MNLVYLTDDSNVEAVLAQGMLKALFVRHLKAVRGESNESAAKLIEDIKAHCRENFDLLANHAKKELRQAQWLTDTDLCPARKQPEYDYENSILARQENDERYW